MKNREIATPTADIIRVICSTTLAQYQVEGGILRKQLNMSHAIVDSITNFGFPLSRTMVVGMARLWDINPQELTDYAEGGWQSQKTCQEALGNTLEYLNPRTIRPSSTNKPTDLHMRLTVWDGHFYGLNQEYYVNTAYRRIILHDCDIRNGPEDPDEYLQDQTNLTFAVMAGIMKAVELNSNYQPVFSRR